MTVSLDTNVLVRLFIRSNPAQSQAAIHCLDRYTEIVVADVAVIELLYTLAYHYQLGRRASVRFVSELLRHPKIRCNRSLILQTMTDFVEHPALSIEDCYLVHTAARDDAVPLLTFDRKLANQLTAAQLLTTSA